MSRKKKPHPIEDRKYKRGFGVTSKYGCYVKPLREAPAAGDGIVQGELGEQCEPPNTDTCDVLCMIIGCGNAIVEPELGEQCEPPKTATCDANCQDIPRPPVADAGPDQTLECTAPTSTDVVLDGTGSSDPDDDPLMFTWTNSFGTANGSMPTVTLSGLVAGNGSELITLEVSDGQLTDSDTTMVTVEDTTAPALEASLLLRPGNGGDSDSGSSDDKDKDSGSEEDSDVVVSVHIECRDVCDPDVVLEAEVNGVPVSDGDVLTTDGDDSDNMGIFVPLEPLGRSDSDSDGGLLELTATCTDASGNQTTAMDVVVAEDDGFGRCGLGFEVAFCLVPLVWLYRRRHRLG